MLYLVCENFALSLSICDFETDLLEDVKLAICVEDGLFEFVYPLICLGILLEQLVDAILVINQFLLHWQDQVLQHRSGFKFDIVPQQLEGGVLDCKSKFVSSLQLFLI